MRRAHRDGISPFRVGLLALIVTVVATYFAFSQANPFSHPYKFSAEFDNAANLKPNSAVRIAGVEVGKVKKVESLGRNGGARAEIEMLDKGLPIHEDAEIKLRPRIFLEGNMFVDIQPGSPSTPELKDGGKIPASQTAAPVQFEEVLRTLQSDTREDLKTLLKEFSKGLDNGGAEAFNRSLPYWEPAYKYGSQANEASLGLEEHDLSKLVRAQGKVLGSLAKNEDDLRDLVTNLNVTFRAFATERASLERAIPALDEVLKVGQPALASLNDALPSLRSFARDATPAAKSSLPTINASLPFVKQARRLVSRSELRGLAADLEDTIPSLAKLNSAQIPFMSESRALSACTTSILAPLATKPIPDPDFNIPNANFMTNSAHGFVALAGESRLSDANTPLFHVEQSAGPFTVVQTDEAGNKSIQFGGLLSPPEGSRPAEPNARPAFRPGIPCETQALADLNAMGGPAEELAHPQPVASAKNKAREAAAQADLQRFLKSMKLFNQGKMGPDPMAKFNKQLQAIVNREQDKLTGKGYREKLVKRSEAMVKASKEAASK